MADEKQRQIDSIEKMVKGIHECLYGDGNPGEGLTDRVSKIEVQIGLIYNQVKWGVRFFVVVVILLLSLLGIKEIPKLW